MKMRCERDLSKIGGKRCVRFRAGRGAIRKNPASADVRKGNMNMNAETDGGFFTCYTSCYKCHRQIMIDYAEDSFETEENVTFLGRLGSMTYQYCPYCGVRESRFSPYDPDQKMDFSQVDNFAASIRDDETESLWPDVEGVTLIDEEEEGDDSWDESEKVAFVCTSCGKKTRLNPKGCDKVFCFYCGKEAVKGD